ncbi:DUF58 domain-containing protein [Streptomyces sp. S.PB5]|uniref:DUF58 domain-containing protein n=1 Tax=Streptomyces sp. S.PB5 TaxID=3020844 RepID=UPI0025B0F353|nr:DUF58 domain-containing protein [Streptomyces sp. S.PB5]MDN3023979.1 DUF58 domain-containing protein [Streptomyces sp. S.PB5]
MLTRTGWGTAGGGAVLTGVGYAFGYREAAALGTTGLLAVAVSVAVLWALPRPRLGAERRIAPRKVGRGEPAESVVTVTNTGDRALRGLSAGDRCGDLEIAVTVPPLRPGAVHELRHPLPTSRRGPLPVGPLRVERVDPLGLVRRRHAYGGSETLLVRPRTCPLPALSAGRSHQVEGSASDVAADGSPAFHAVREYAFGDDLRRVHWRSTARAGKLIVRQPADTSLPHTTLVLDTREHAHASQDDFELAVDCAASLAYAAARSRLPVHLLDGVGTLLRTKGSGEDGEALLDRLALVTRSDGPSETVAFDVLERHRDGGTLIVVGGTGAAEGLGAAAGRVRHRFDGVIVLRAGAATGAEPVVGVWETRVASLEELAAVWRAEAPR